MSPASPKRGCVHAEIVDPLCVRYASPGFALELLDRLYLPLQLLRKPDVVGIEERHPFSTRLPGPPVSGNTLPLVGLKDIASLISVVLLSADQCLNGIPSPVGGPVIDNNDFELPVRLGKDALQGSLHLLSPIECRDHNRNQRLSTWQGLNTHWLSSPISLLCLTLS